MKKIALCFILLILAFAFAGPKTPGDNPGPAAQDPERAAAGAPESTEPLESFEPTEKLPADSAISFPVDI